MSSRPRILVAEDDASIRTLVRAHLELAGYEVHIARNGLEAMRQIRGLRPAAMVLDINMPEMDGFDVLRSLHSHDLLIPVLVLTARHAEDDVRQAVSLGARDYLSKPFSEAQLLARVRRLLRPAIPAAVLAAQREAVAIGDILAR